MSQLSLWYHNDDLSVHYHQYLMAFCLVFLRQKRNTFDSILCTQGYRSLFLISSHIDCLRLLYHSRNPESIFILTNKNSAGSIFVRSDFMETRSICRGISPNWAASSEKELPEDP